MLIFTIFQKNIISNFCSYTITVHSFGRHGTITGICNATSTVDLQSLQRFFYYKLLKLVELL